MARNLDRAPPKKQQLKRFHLLCEGGNTEPEYFQALVDHFQAANIEITLIAPAGAPQTIAAKADSIRNRTGKRSGFEIGDEVWAVFDRDEHPEYNSARNICKQKGIHVAYSDPCFELWLVLHYRQHNAPVSHHEIQRTYETLDASYKSAKGKRCNFKSLAPRVKEAEANAAALLKARFEEGDPEGCPSTTVHLLTSKLRGEVQ
jgi:hypothetical protein